MGKHRAPEGAATDFDAATSALADVTGDYTVDVTHTRIGVRARHAMVTTVRGAFTDFSGTAHLDTATPAASSVRLRIAAASIDTGTPDRDAHLRSADFLDVEQHPEMVFVSTAVEQVDRDVYRVTGDLTIKAVTRPVSIDFTLTGSALDPFGNMRVGFEGALAIKRSEWDLTWNAMLDTGGVLVSDRIQVEFDVSAIKDA
ncbi:MULTISPECIES: YceI family protein [unclassified Modestobacter]|uniref:YceI family protein n=1 Tax=unclassified Modestobacter TaxID=2643866 RepID=UPI0022AB000C|nr:MULTISPECIES: YceI family protein [unclassified Modestobacter]MCZ2826463.1 YceI family protein [Modestobacter sp. VKM Ac-2981]MCZ2852472.1 YceI family protein [Modestobacter sp. VKM Ac-2982]